MFYLICLLFMALGAIIGSFSVAQVWRIRALELRESIKQGKAVDQKEWNKLKPLVSSKKHKDRSHCLNCQYQLRWFDLVPVLSWLSLGGKCRKCRKPIGKLEFFTEVIVSLFFGVICFSLGSDFWSDFSLFNFFRAVVLFSALSCLVILFIYDAKWSLLPVKLMWVFNSLAFVYFILVALDSNISSMGIASNLLISFLLFPVIYFILSFISKGAWVGDGDWILALGLVMLLPNSPIFSIFLMFISNIIGLLVILTLTILKKKRLVKGAQIPFGPAMILACLILFIFQSFFNQIINFLVV